jgi:LysR family transcriptional regulator, hypochlorite-specific transcription factor HypT
LSKPVLILHRFYNLQMESKWLEDFVTLSETRSFSRAAELRNVTQPAFSRRIQALEAWAGTDLIDRTSYPTKLTPAGQVFYEQAMEMLASINTTRALLRGKSAGNPETIAFAAPHTLAMTFFPQWLTEVEKGFGPMSTRLSAFNVHDAVMQLVNGGCDLVMVYNHPRQPMHLDPSRYDTVTLGSETMRAYARADAQGAPETRLPGTRNKPVPFLSYTPGAYLARMVDVLATESPRPLHLTKVFETDMAEVLKMMALAGHGIAFLPESAVRREINGKSLAIAGEASIEMEIRLIRERPHSTADKSRSNRASLASLWEYLTQTFAPR